MLVGLEVGAVLLGFRSLVGGTPVAGISGAMLAAHVGFALQL